MTLIDKDQVERIEFARSLVDTLYTSDDDSLSRITSL